MRDRGDSSRRSLRLGFTLIELLASLAVIVLLLGILVPAMGGVRGRAAETSCASRMREIGKGIILYAQENGGEYPRSFHSAGAHREPGWARSVAPYLGVSEAAMNGDWTKVFNDYFRAPEDDETNPYVYSYGLNVHFELDPRGDDYEGAPATWRKLVQVPNPSRTLLLAEVKPIQFGDHLMAHLWTSVEGPRNAVNFDVHDGRSNYLFADGHVESMEIEETLDRSRGLNLWNPSLAH